MFAKTVIEIGLRALAAELKKGRASKLREFLVDARTQNTMRDVYEAYSQLVAEVDGDGARVPQLP